MSRSLCSHFGGKPLDLDLGTTTVQFELDTGPAVTVMAESALRRLFPTLKLRRCSVDLKTYTGERMKTLGEVTAQFAYQDQEAKSLSLAVVQGSGPALLGRNRLQHFVLD